MKLPCQKLLTQRDKHNQGVTDDECRNKRISIYKKDKILVR
jgi:hypothetical protein